MKYQGKGNRRYFLDWLIKENNIKVMAEVGVRDGRTTFHLLDHNTDLVVYAVDKYTGKFYHDEIAGRYGDRLKPICQFSVAAAKEIEDASLDLVFIDASHQYEWVSKDIPAYQPKLKQGGWLTGHDIDRPGVKQAVDELINNYQEGPDHIWMTQV